MTKAEMIEKIKKKEEMYALWDSVIFPFPLSQFFDLDSYDLLDEKIEVLTALKEGKTVSEIPKFYDILELYPKDGRHWD